MLPERSITSVYNMNFRGVGRDFGGTSEEHQVPQKKLLLFKFTFRISDSVKEKVPTG